MVNNFHAEITVLLADDYATCAQSNSAKPYIYLTDLFVTYFTYLKKDVSLNTRILPLAYGALLLALALFKATQYWKQNGYSGSRLMLVIIRDQILYYVL